MGDRERLRELVDSLPDSQVQAAISLLEHLEDNEPLSADEAASIQSSLDDIRNGRMIMLEDYERERSK